MERHKLNWFERYTVDILEKYGGAKNLIIGSLCSFGMMGFVPNFSYEGELVTLYNNDCKGV